MGCTSLVSPQKHSSYYANFDWVVNISAPFLTCPGKKGWSDKTSPGDKQLIVLPEAPSPPHISARSTNRAQQVSALLLGSSSKRCEVNGGA